MLHECSLHDSPCVRSPLMRTLETAPCLSKFTCKLIFPNSHANSYKFTCKLVFPNPRANLYILKPPDVLTTRRLHGKRRPAYYVFAWKCPRHFDWCILQRVTRFRMIDEVCGKLQTSDRETSALDDTRSLQPPSGNEGHGVVGVLRLTYTTQTSLLLCSG